jgi:D-alanyl-D-alanine carboxypeptidase
MDHHADFGRAGFHFGGGGLMSRTDDIRTTVRKMLIDAYPDSTAPGAVVLLVKDGQILCRTAIGRANLEHQVAMKSEMPFRVASLSKPLTCTAVLMLVESGQLTLKDTLDQLLPGYPLGETPVSVEHLMTHTAGIPEYTELPEWWPMHRQDVSTGELIDLFKARPHAFVPGTHWSYCNSGYVLLGAIIETISGISYAEFLSKNIFAPLEMSSTFSEATPGRIVPHRVSGYSPVPAGYADAEYLSLTHFHAAGGLTSTVDDLARWFAALHAGTLISAETLRRMWTPYTLADGRSARYGYGWWVGTCLGQRTAEHYGSLPGCSNYLLALPDDDVLIIVLSNDDGKLNRVEQLTVEIAGAAIGKTYQSPAPFPLPAPELGRFEGTYLSREGTQLTLACEAGELTLRTPGGERFTLQPLVPGEFFFPEIPESRLVFSQEEDRGTTLEWRPRRGIPVQARKTS